MIALIQRVTQASVTIDGTLVAQTGPGMLALIGIEKPDTQQSAEKLAKRLLDYRLFEDEHGKMNLDLSDSRGQLMLVPQFTLVADTAKGRRPGFSRAASPAHATLLFDHLAAKLAPQVSKLGLGRFGANMQVALVNDGPVTFWLRTDP